ncbi:hypothetical protein D3C80_996260 [compost metagenome]
MNGGAQGHGEVGDAVAHAVVLAGLQCHRDGGGAGHGAECGEVGGQHVLDEHGGGAAQRQPGADEEHGEPEPVHDDGHHQHHAEGLESGEHGAFHRHLDEDAGDVEGQQRDDHAGQQAVYDVTALIGDPAQVGGLGGADADAEHEGGGQCRHHPEQRRYLEVDVGAELDGGLRRGLGGRGQLRDQLARHREGEQARQYGGAVGEGHRLAEQLAGVLRQAGDAAHDEEQDDERNGEGDQLTYHCLGREQHPCDPFRGVEAEQETGEDAGNQIEDEFHGGIQVLVSVLLFNLDFNAAF